MTANRLAVLILLAHDLVLSQNPDIVALTPPVNHGEEPSWDYRNNVLYYIDEVTGEIHRHDYETGKNTFIQLNGRLGPVIQVQNHLNVLIVGLNRSILSLEWDGHSPPKNIKTLATVDKNQPNTQFNDGKADRYGRLWIGLKGIKEGTVKGSLYEFTCANRHFPSIKIKNVALSNGLTWNAASTKFFYVDTPTRTVVSYDFDVATAAISNKTILINLNNTDFEGNPDGMTIDALDNLWVALYKGGAVINIDSSNGNIIRVVRMPVPHVSSVMWGGPYLDQLFVTSGKDLLTEEELKLYPTAGSVFQVSSLPVTGTEIYQTDLYPC